MDLASRMIWRFGHLLKLDTSNFSVKSQCVALHSCHLTSFDEETNFSVKPSWEVHWIIMFQKTAVWFSSDSDMYLRAATAGLSQTRSNILPKNVFGQLLLIRAYWNPKSRQGLNLACLACCGGPVPNSVLNWS